MSLLLSATSAATKAPPAVTANRTLTPAVAPGGAVGYSASPAAGTLSNTALLTFTITNVQAGIISPDTLVVIDNVDPKLPNGLVVYVLIPSLSSTVFQGVVTGSFGQADINIPGIYAHLNGRIGVATPIGIEAN